MKCRSYAQQKAALTRAAKKGYDAVLAECRRAIAEWDSRQPPFTYGWPDDWARWQRALDDAHPSVFGAPRLEELAPRRLAPLERREVDMTTRNASVAANHASKRAKLHAEDPERWPLEETRYLIKRFRFNGNYETIARGLTLEEAQAHCQREDTQGDGWFDGYDVDR